MPHFWPAQHQAEDQLHLTHHQHRLPAQQPREHRRDSTEVNRWEPRYGLPHLVGRDSAATGELRDSLLHRGDGLSPEHTLRRVILYQARSANSAFWLDKDTAQHPHPPTSSQFVFALQWNSGTACSSSLLCPCQSGSQCHVGDPYKESRIGTDGVQLRVRRGLESCRSSTKLWENKPLCSDWQSFARTNGTSYKSDLISKSRITEQWK